MKANSIKIQYPEESDKTEIVLSMARNNETIQKVSKLRDITEKDKLLKVDIKQYRKKRSLDANAMLWVMLNEIAIALQTSKDEVYLEMLDRYGAFTHIVVKSEMVEKVKREWRLTRELGEIIVNGQTGIQLQCYFGSSTYNTKEFSILLNGVIYEAKELGIDTITENEKLELMSKWGER